MRQQTFGSVLVLLLGVAVPSWAGSSSVTMGVSVKVVARTVLSVVEEPAEVVVSPADVARGYVELPDALSFHVHSNNPGGYLVLLRSTGGPFAGATVSWASSEVSVTSTEAWIAQPYRRGIHRVVATVRLAIPPGVAPGRYHWPIAVTGANL